MHDQPTAAELLEAIAAFLREEVVGELTGRARFHALVAANSAAIVARELELGPANRAAESERLTVLLATGATVEEANGGESSVAGRASDALEARLRLQNVELCERIDAGEADDGAFRRAVLDHLKATVAEQLKIDNPKFDLTVVAE